MIIIFRRINSRKLQEEKSMSIPYNDEAYEAVIKIILNDIYYVPGLSLDTKISRLRTYTEIILRRLLGWPMGKELTLGDKNITAELKRKGYTEDIFRHALRTINRRGSNRTHTQITTPATDQEYQNVEQSLLNLYGYLFYVFFRKYPFGSNPDIMSKFSLLTPVIRYIALNELYKKDPLNINVIDKLSLAIMKAFSLERALAWLEENREALSKISSVTDADRKALIGLFGLEQGNQIADMGGDMYSQCRTRVIQVAELRNNGGISYDSFETALKYYKENGIVEGDTSDVKEFNDLMAFVYIGRKEAEEQIASLDESQYIINSITWVLPPEQA